MTQWRTGDILDLEFFLAEDAHVSEEELSRRDRELYLESIKPYIPHGSRSEKSFRRVILKHWLEERRHEFRDHAAERAVLPSEAFSEAQGLTMIILGVVGAVSGSSLALSLLVYRGVEPVNVSVYFGVLVLLQILLFLFTLVRGLFIRISGSFLKRHSALVGLVRGITDRLFRSFSAGLSRYLGAERRSEIESVLGILKGKRGAYGSIFAWSFVSSTQLFGICFNLGVLVTTLVRVLTADLAFGWQSTLAVSSKTVYSIVHTLSIPWSWIVPQQYAHPSLAQIEGSRMVLKDGIYALASSDLVSWWPFLILAVLLYGLVPRVIFFIWSFGAQRYALSRLDFSQTLLERIIMRMITPVINSSGRPTEGVEHPGDIPFHGDRPEEDWLSGDTRAVVLVPSELVDHLDREELDATVKERLHWTVTGVMGTKIEPDADLSTLREIRSLGSRESHAVVLLIEGWQPPITEALNFIQTLRTAVGPATRIAVLLVGRPSNDTVFTPVGDVDRHIWKRSLEAIGDQNLRIEASGVSP
ncbi:MAG: DUF2868 domain-containing protein [Desulfomonilia bacterium]